MPLRTLAPCLLLPIAFMSAPTQAIAAEEVVTEEILELSDQSKNQSNDENDKKGTDDQPKLSVTKHSATIGGDSIDYTATAGKLRIKTDEGKDKADIFFVAYTKDDTKATGRPITFCFNGGPGSSSVWLHLGMLGPQRVKLPSDATRAKPPAKLIDNPYSLLDTTDLVFIDPVSTGYSRPTKGEKKNQFHGYDEDVRSVGQFIHDYTTKFGRWGSPKFLLGESYGGLRAAGLSGELQGRYRMYLNGIVIISGVIDFQTLRASGNNDIGYVMFLPNYATTAWYHKALSDEMQALPVEKIYAEAQEFASTTYLRALLAGDSLPEEQRKLVLARMSQLTGLSTAYLDRANLRVSMQRFGKELLRSRKQVIGRFDSRYTGIDRDHVGHTMGHDPSGSAVYGPFTSAMNQYLREVLKVEEQRVYEILTGNVHPWDYSEFTNRYVNASETLRRAMSDNPFLKVHAACGYYDLATPSAAMEYTRDHLGLAAKLRDNFSMSYYEAGHMMYVHEPSLRQLRDNLMKFYEAALVGDGE